MVIFVFLKFPKPQNSMHWGTMMSVGGFWLGFSKRFFSLPTSLSLYDADDSLTIAGEDSCMMRLVSFSSSDDDDDGSVSFAI